MANNFVISNGDLEVVVSSLGAELISVKAEGVERLWQNENGGWSGHAPVLFPVCGGCGVTVDGVKHDMGAHGFARKSEFTLVEKSDAAIEFSLCSDSGTRQKFPFDFELGVRYALCGNSIEIVYNVTNRSATTVLPFSCGGHESFVLKGGVENYKIIFEQKECLVRLFHGADGLLDGRTHDYGEMREFALPADFLQNGNTLIFSDIKSRSVELCELSGKKIAVSEFADFCNLLLWRPNGADMICIEPWGNLPDPSGVPDVEFAEKMKWKLQPHESKIISRKVTYCPIM